MKFPRTGGILLHPTSLPGAHGIGDLGDNAVQFVEILKAAGAGIWQMLPLGPTGYGDSPYQCFSAFAGNPLLIDLTQLRDRGWLHPLDLEDSPPNGDSVDYEAVIAWKMPRLRLAAERFARQGDSDFDAFCHAEAAWLDDFALYMALKEEHGMAAWPLWPRDLASRHPAAIAAARQRLAASIAAHRFIQWSFFRQFTALREHCHQSGIRLMGDIPIYAAADSADTWSSPEQFHLLPSGEPATMAGVPPDYFSATGQLWGNPIYNWARMEQDGYRWWIERFRQTFRLFDAVRVDHFRGFQAYWQVPAGETTAMNGEWIPGPGAKVFEAVEGALGELAILAENLGVITPEVEAIRARFGFPGMAILQFAFGTDPQAPDFKPHNYPRDVVAYTGTHDNDTTVGWWTSTGDGDSTRTAADIAEERRFTLEYLNADGAEIHWTFIRALMASVASTVIFPVQDLLGLGTAARMNMPSTLGGNWRWRLREGELGMEIADRLHRMAVCYDRLPAPKSKA